VQRSTAEQIDALEIDQAAYEQAVDNFENSPGRPYSFFSCWFRWICEEPEDEYDLIVSNPHFIQNYKTENEPRFSTLNHAFWESNWGRRFLLSEDGIFSVIVHKEEKDSWPCQWIWMYPKITR
jgi:tRNA1Val (adenine37-N6)-methyltransferase